MLSISRRSLDLCHVEGEGVEHVAPDNGTFERCKGMREVERGPLERERGPLERERGMVGNGTGLVESGRDVVGERTGVIGEVESIGCSGQS